MFMDELMKSIVFDAGPIISLTTNNLLWVLRELEGRYKGKFYIAEAVKNELVDKPLTIKRFKFEALQVSRYIKEDVIRVIGKKQLKQKTLELLTLANTCFKARNNFVRIVHYGEMAGLAACLNLNSDAFSVDERTTRLLIENPKRLAQILGHKLHTRIEVDGENLKKLGKLIGGIKVIRSVELVTIAYEKGLLDNYLADVKEPRKTLLDSILWGVKLNGCSVSKREIEQIIRLEGRK